MHKRRITGVVGRGEMKGGGKGHEVTRHPIPLGGGVPVRDDLSVPISQHDREARFEEPRTAGFASNDEG